MENDVKYCARANNYETKILKKKQENIISCRHGKVSCEAEPGALFNT